MRRQSIVGGLFATFICTSGFAQNAQTPSAPLMNQNFTTTAAEKAKRAHDEVQRMRNAAIEKCITSRKEKGGRKGDGALLREKCASQYDERLKASLRNDPPIRRAK